MKSRYRRGIHRQARYIHIKAMLSAVELWIESCLLFTITATSVDRFASNFLFSSLARKILNIWSYLFLIFIHWFDTSSAFCRHTSSFSLTSSNKYRIQIEYQPPPLLVQEGSASSTANWETAPIGQCPADEKFYLLKSVLADHPSAEAKITGWIALWPCANVWNYSIARLSAQWECSFRTMTPYSYDSVILELNRI